MDNLSRLNEAEEADRQGVFHILGEPISFRHMLFDLHHTIGIFENILSVNPELAPQLVEKTTIMPWILSRIQSKAHDENRGYAAELLSILLQNNAPNRLAYAKADGVEISLKVLSVRAASSTLGYTTNPHTSNTAVVIQQMLMKPNSWRTSLTHFALRSPNPPSRSYSLKQKDQTS